jgi:cytochrome c oxidase cbb3-type subunit 3
MKAFALAWCAAGLLAAASRHRTNPYEGSAEAAQAGAKLFARHCAPCHGRNAEGRGRAPALHSALIHDAPAAALFDTLTNGVMQRGMPSWAHLPEARRWQIVTYLKTLK